MKRWILLLTLGLASTLILPAPASRAESAFPTFTPVIGLAASPQQAGLAQTVTQTEQLTGSLRIATLVAGYFNRQVEEILALRARDIGFGCIAKALFIAVEANVPLEQVLQMHLQGIGWGEIRQGLNLPAGMPHASLGQIVSQGRGHNKGAEWTPPGQAKRLGKGKNQGKP